ncbi:MAG: hypothetical protein U5P10_18000 [Spirochaetia bacterium]|nr:hypothetical protein [Spirochaetia bacterium]
MKTQAAIDKLEDKVFGNPDVFDDELPQEMLEEFKRDVSKPLEDEFHNIVDGKNKEISELVSINEKKEKAIENSRKVINKVHLRSSLISKIITYIFAIIVAVIFIACIILTHTSISNKIIKYTIQGVLAVLTILNIGFGFTLRLFFGKLKDGIEKRIVKFLT